MNRRWPPLLLVPTMLLLFAGLGAAVHRGTALQPPTCQQLQFRVALAPGAPARYKVVGWLCGRPPLTGRTVQVLISGTTQTHLYWDFPLRPQQYSYVRALTNAGYATLNLDRLGSGQSDHPLGDQVTVAAQAYVVHQIIQTLHTGQGPASSFGKVILVGHSAGVAMAIVEANRYADVDGLIFTGFLHTYAPATSVLFGLFCPVACDSRFAQRHLPPGYETTLPGALAVVTLYRPNTDPDVAALQEARKDATAAGEDAGIDRVVSTPALVQGIHVPILAGVGQYDAIFCSAPSCPEARAEPAVYDCHSQSAGERNVVATICAPRAELELVVVPNAGHNLNLHRNARAWFAIVRHWSDRHFGPCPQGCH
jgi:pimeloyl-ACP methyl ester carboxylesterase